MPSKVIKVLDQIMAPFQEKRHEKGLKDKIYKVLVTGIPNVGKSTFINALTKRKATKTSRDGASVCSFMVLVHTSSVGKHSIG